MSWDTLDNDDLGADVILTTGTMNAAYDNPRAMAQREANTPSFAQVPVTVVLTSGSSWSWPNGVTAAEFCLVGGGGGGGGGTGSEYASDGGDTTITYNSVTTTAEGGDGGKGDDFTGRGGNAGGGDLSIFGGTDFGGHGANSFLGQGGVLGGVAGNLVPVKGAGGAPEPGGQGGCGGETVFIRVVRVTGQNSVSYAIGAGGAKYNSSGQDGAAGIIIIKY